MTLADPTIDPTHFRTVLGHFCTGITVITAEHGDERVGFACQSFAALSLDPPLILFCPSRASRSWPVIRDAGRFVVNVLASTQGETSAVFGGRRTDKFEAVPWTPSPGGAPIIDGVLTWIECTVETIHEAGDHYIVVGRVVALGDRSEERPLLFHRGQYTVTEPVPEPEPWLTWCYLDDWI
jgi:3-hydroxy-9,10-secoandrosta-1,3,5(10)-triene-9,17-dione monooxygenase reductase component